MKTIVLALIMLLLLYLIKEKIAIKKTTKIIVDRLCKKYYILEKATLNVCANLIIGQLAHRKVGQYQYN